VTFREIRLRGGLHKMLRFGYPYVQWTSCFACVTIGRAVSLSSGRHRSEQAPSVDEIVREYGLAEPIYVTRPSMPNLTEYTEFLRGIWERRWLTNEGLLHQELERRLCEYLGVQHLSLFSNGTLALLVALNTLGIQSGEVITTPFTFPATAHVLYWSGIRPVFGDIDESTFNLDPNRIEHLIGPQTKAILAVHVYGTPCDVNALQSIADRHGLQVIYDAAHAFGVKYRERSIVEYGDLTMLSFHATKLFTTIEGGALISRTAAQKHQIDLLKNFGIAGEEHVIEPGINGKMDEFQAAFGLLHLRMVEDEIVSRKAVATIYRDRLANIPGLRLLLEQPDTKPNFGYFPILVDAGEYGMSRDQLFQVLRNCNIISRKYFYPLISRAPCYAALPSAEPARLPIAEHTARQVLCLPIYGTLESQTVRRICDIIQACHRAAAPTATAGK
jgi:dTDP-4-amino-4,6-dideoxygalactose transaminase